MGSFVALMAFFALGIGAWLWRSRLRAYRNAGARKNANSGASSGTAQQDLPRFADITDPREAATILMLCVAKAGGAVEKSHFEVIETQIQRRFDLDAETTSELIHFAARMVDTLDDPFTPVSLLSRKLHAMLVHKELIELEDMLHAVARADGEPNGAQKALCDDVALKAGM